MNSDLHNLRSSYQRGTLERKDLPSSPLKLAKVWLNEAIQENIHEANAMSLATVNQSKQPTVRTVLLKHMDEGFVFYTNYRSRKGQELEHNPRVAILFFWKELERQLRVEGKIEKISEKDAIGYFQSRPKGSQLGAWASPQSQVINGRSELNDRLHELEDIYQHHDHLPKPPHWGGYRVIPHYYEFWQGRDNRLHDRFEYKRNDDGWVINRLAP